MIELSINDHSLVYICRKIGIPNSDTPNVIETIQYVNFSPSELQFDLSQAFGYFSFDPDPNSAWNKWKEIFLQIADSHAPCKSKNSKKRTLPLAV